MRFPHDVDVRYRGLVAMAGSQDRDGRNRARYQREAGMLRRSAEEIQDHRLRRQLLQIACTYERLARDDQPIACDSSGDIDGLITRSLKTRHI